MIYCGQVEGAGIFINVISEEMDMIGKLLLVIQDSQSSFPDCCIGEYVHSQLHIIPFLDSPSAVKLQYRHPPLFKASSLPPGPSFLHYPAFSMHLPSLLLYTSQFCRAICWSTGEHPSATGFRLHLSTLRDIHLLGLLHGLVSFIKLDATKQ